MTDTDVVSKTKALPKPVLLVVGAGFGGFGFLRRFLEGGGADLFEVVVVDAKDWFSIGGTWQFAWTDRLPLAETKLSLKDADLPVSVDLRLHTTVTEWRPRSNQVVLSDDSTLSYDTIVVACGVEPDPTLISGMEMHVNICSFDSVARQRQEAQALCQKSSIEKVTFVLAIGSCPYKCPPVPFELTFLLEEMIREHGIRDNARLTITCPVQWPMPPAFEESFQTEMRLRNIEYLPNHALEKVETAGDGCVLHYQNGTRLHATVLWTIYPLRAPDFVQQAIPDNMRGGFVDIKDKVTHAVADNAHVIGDCCIVPVVGNLTIPKAGEFAWKMGQSVADAILKKASGSDEPLVVDRRAGCVAEIGQGQGMALVLDLSKFCQENGDPQFEIKRSDQGGNSKG